MKEKSIRLSMSFCFPCHNNSQIQHGYRGSDFFKEDRVGYVLSKKMGLKG